MQRTIEHPAFLTTLAILRNLVKTVHFNLFIIHQLTVLTIFTLSDANTTARPLLSPSLVLQQCLSHCSIAAIGVSSEFQRVSPLSWQEMWRPADPQAAARKSEQPLKAYPRWNTSSSKATPLIMPLPKSIGDILMQTTTSRTLLLLFFTSLWLILSHHFVTTGHQR